MEQSSCMHSEHLEEVEGEICEELKPSYLFFLVILFLVVSSDHQLSMI